MRWRNCKVQIQTFMLFNGFETHAFPDRFPKEVSFKVQTLRNQRMQLTLENGVLYRHWEDIPRGGLHPKLQLVLPTPLIPYVDQLAQFTSRRSHGICEKVWSWFYWSGQRKDVEQWCSNWVYVISSLMPVLQCSLSRPMQRIAMDVSGPLPETGRGNRYILVVGDYFTRWKEHFQWGTRKQPQ